MLSQCTPKWRDMGAAVGETNQRRKSGGKAGRKKRITAGAQACVCL